MSKKILFFNSTQAKQDYDELIAMQTHLQSVVDEFFKLQLPFGIETADDLSQLAKSPESFLQTKIVDHMGAINAGSFRLRKEVVLENLDLPDFSPLYGIAKQIEDWKINSRMRHIKYQKGVVSLVPGTKESIEEKYTTYAVGKAEEEAIDALNDLARAIEKLNLVAPLSSDTELKQLVWTDPVTGEVTPKEDFFHRRIVDIRKRREQTVA